MKHLTDQERDLLVKMTESIEDVIAANSGILRTLDRLGDSDTVLGVIPYTSEITNKLQGMLQTIKEYAKVTQSDLIV